MLNPRPSDERAPNLPRIALAVIGALTVIALILGIATGAINDRTFNRPAASPSDPVTIP